MVRTKSLNKVIEAVKHFRNGYIYGRDPCFKDIAKRSGMSRQTVAECVNWLEQHGLVETRKVESEKRVIRDRFNNGKKTELW